MKNIIIIACLLFCGSLFADEPKKPSVEVKVQPKVGPSVEVKVQPKVGPSVEVKVQPKVGVVTPNVRPLPGQHYWRHPTFGWGYWYYPAPAVPVPANYYIDQYGRVVPNGYTYDTDGNLVPLVATPVVPAYPYYGRWWRWWR